MLAFTAEIGSSTILPKRPLEKWHRDRCSEQSDKCTELDTHYIDFNGEGFAPVDRMRTVYWYEGETNVKRLPVYPIRFVKDSAQSMQRLHTRGERFRSLVSQPPSTVSYVGWTLTPSIINPSPPMMSSPSWNGLIQIVQ